MNESKYVQDALDTLVVQGIGGAAMAQVFATLAVAQAVKDLVLPLELIEERLNEIEKRIDQGTDLLVNEIAAIPSVR